MRWLRSPWLWLVCLLLAAAGLKVWLLSIQAFPFNSDEAIVGLMARHILLGERPVFFYGQAYMGSLDAWLVAGAFMIFGSQVWAIRLVQIILYLLTIIATIFTGKVAFRSWKQGLLAGGFLAIPAVNTTLYTTVSLGGYGEALLLGSLGLLTGFWMLEREDLRSPLWLGLWGILLGLGLWANALALVFFLPMGIALLRRMFRAKSPGRMGWQFLLGLTGFGLGAAPWWFYAAQNGFSHLMAEMGGTAVAVEQVSWLQRAAAHLVNLVILGFPAAIGLRPPWEVRWLALPLLPVALFFWLAVLVFLFPQPKQKREFREAYHILGGIVMSLGVLFVTTPFGVDPSGRYFLPLVIPLGLGGAGMILHWSRDRRWVQPVLMAAILIFQFWGVLESALLPGPGITTQFYQPAQVNQQALPELMEFLSTHGETTGFTNYWVAYPLAFRSDEELIFSPALPYHPDLRYTARDDRYQPYTDRVKAAKQAAYITTRNPELDKKLSAEFSRLGLKWQETWIGEFHVFHALSRYVGPEELDLGEMQP